MKTPARLLVTVSLLGACGSTAGGGTAGAGSGGGASGASGAAGTSGASGGGQAGAGSGGTAGGAAGKGAIPACLNVEPIPSTQTPCHTDADCHTQFWTCQATFNVGNSPGACGGVCLAAIHECTTDGDCGQGKLCIEQPNGPCECPAQGLDLLCVAACTTTSCASNETCDVASGHCKPTPCGSAYACTAGLACAPTRAGADANGCVIASCVTDGYACSTSWVCGPGPDRDPHGCSSVSCVGGGFKCPMNYDCDANSSSPHHCTQRMCTSDRQCDCGACITGYCQDHVYVCSPPLMTPA
jgi:hypothetical protein